MQRPAFICASCARALRRLPAPAPSTPNRALATTASAAQSVSSQHDRSELPRWKQTPPAMRMKFRLRPLPDQPPWKVNEESSVLKKAMDAFVGDAAGPGVRGRDLLEEEVMWLSVTHKSFEQGARGFNDRLAFLGRQIVDLETSKALLTAPLLPPENEKDKEDSLERMSKHPALKGLNNVTTEAKRQVLSTERLAGLAKSYSVDRAVRWVPRKSDRLKASGFDTIMTHAMYAIIGAIAMQKGGQLAHEVARERILKPLGL